MLPCPCTWRWHCAWRRSWRGAVADTCSCHTAHSLQEPGSWQQTCLQHSGILQHRPPVRDVNTDTHALTGAHTCLVCPTLWSA